MDWDRLSLSMLPRTEHGECNRNTLKMRLQRARRGISLAFENESDISAMGGDGPLSRWEQQESLDGHIGQIPSEPVDQADPTISPRIDVQSSVF